MLSTADLIGMRGTLTGSLPDQCLVLRDSYESDGAGGQTVTTSAVNKVACRLGEPLNAFQQAEQLAASRVSAIAQGMLTMPYGTDVLEQDRIAFIAGSTTSARWKGTWVISTGYNVGDVVSFGPAPDSYRAISANTGYQPDENPARWQKLHTMEVAIVLEPRSNPIDSRVFYRELR